MYANDVDIFDPDHEDVILGKVRCNITPNTKNTKKRLHKLHDRVSNGRQPISDGKISYDCSKPLLESTFRR